MNVSKVSHTVLLCGCPAARYGTHRPPDIASQYWRLANLPVQLMAGSHDGIVPPINVQKHYRAMAVAGMKVCRRKMVGRSVLWVAAVCWQTG